MNDDSTEKISTDTLMGLVVYARSRSGERHGSYKFLLTAIWTKYFLIMMDLVPISLLKTMTVEVINVSNYMIFPSLLLEAKLLALQTR